MIDKFENYKYIIYKIKYTAITINHTNDQRDYYYDFSILLDPMNFLLKF